MDHEEIAGIYNHIRKMGGYRFEARTVIAGMMILARRWTASSQSNFSVSREEDNNWALVFTIIPEYGANRNTRSMNNVCIRMDKQSINLRPSPNKIGRMQVLRIEGDYDAFQHDWTLLKMFSSEWEDSQ
jgi:hypothetical protein